MRVFEEITGTTPHHFLACLRVQRAKELLLNSQSPITEICFDVGYASLGSFSATFSTLVGVSPQQFRQLPKRLTPTQFAKAIWHFLAQGVSLVPATAPAIGEVCEITSGPLRGTRGVYERPGKQGRLVLIVELLSMGTAVEVACGQVEPVRE